MHSNMARPTEPSDLQRLGVVVVVLLDLLLAAPLAWLRNQEAAALVDVRVGAGVRAKALLLWKVGVSRARRAHVGGVAGLTVPLPFAVSWPSAFRAKVTPPRQAFSHGALYVSVERIVRRGTS